MSDVEVASKENSFGGGATGVSFGEITGSYIQDAVAAHLSRTSSRPVEIADLHLREGSAEAPHQFPDACTGGVPMWHSSIILIGINTEILEMNEVNPRALKEFPQVFPLFLLVGNTGKDQVVDHAENPPLPA
jgi:hypothetical protein